MVSIVSFGFKFGTLAHADFQFDVRSLPNPYYDPALRALTGLDEPVRDYLRAQPLVTEMADDIAAFLKRWLPRIREESRSYATVGIGCTGGQHRSVYLAEDIGARLAADGYQVLVRHRQLGE